MLTSSLWAKKGDIQSVFIYYGDELAYDIAGVHDAIIVQPHSLETYTHRFKTYQEKIYVYVSVAELEDDTHKDWILGKNESWNSFVADIRKVEYQDFLLNKMQKLYDLRFRNFFFDSLDSYQYFLTDNSQRKSYEKAMITFFQRFNKKFPEAKLIINRGFEILPKVKKYCDAVLVESLYHGLDEENGGYKITSQDDTKWLLEKLEEVKNYDLDIIVLDYMPLADKTKVKKVVKKISVRGFAPYIGNSKLDEMGKSSVDYIKREILLLYDSLKALDGQTDSMAHLLLSTPIEYLGYIPILKDVQDGYPKSLDRYAGVVVVFSDEQKNMRKYYEWVKKVVDMGIKIAFFGDSGIPNSSYLRKLGIKVTENKDELYSEYPIIKKDEMIGYEIEPIIKHRYNFYNPKNSENLLVTKNSKNEKSVLASITPWGGYILDTAYLTNLRKENYWNINPFKFLAKSLRLKHFPIPDVMTKNGRRLLFIHIDGDGLASGVEFVPEEKIAAQQLLESIVKKYNLPHGISIIEGEVAKYGVYPKFAEISQLYSKAILYEPNVLPATHTYSHPFNWGKVERNPTITGYNLPVTNFVFSPQREIGDSLKFINQKLTPPDKKAKALFWSGNCLPGEETLKYVAKNDILAINGGGTTITTAKNTLSRVSPIGLKRGKYYQIYAAVENENVYTNDWLGPFWGYELAIQTFKITDKPRLKPINIYYHFYITTKMASLNSLRKVYNWALTQEINPIYVTEYIQKAHSFYYVSVAKKGDEYIFGGLNYIDELRIPKSLGVVDIQNSKGVIGFKDKYIHLNSKNVSLKFNQNDNNSGFYLIDTSGDVEIFTKDKVLIKSEIEITAKFHLPQNCKITTSLRGYQTARVGNEFSISSKTKRRLNFNYRCD